MIYRALSWLFFLSDKVLIQFKKSHKNNATVVQEMDQMEFACRTCCLAIGLTMCHTNTQITSWISSCQRSQESQCWRW